MNKDAMIAAFNEWMRQYIEEPERFEASFRSVEKFKADEAGGKSPTYGAVCTAFMKSLASQLPKEQPTTTQMAGELVTFEHQSNSGVMEWVDADEAFERINSAYFMARWPQEGGGYRVAYCCHNEDANLYALDETDEGLIWRHVGDAPEYLVPALVPEFA